MRADLLDPVSLCHGSDVHVCRLDVYSSIRPIRYEEDAHLVRIALYPQLRFRSDIPSYSATVSSYSYHLSLEQWQGQPAGFIVRRFLSMKLQEEKLSVSLSTSALLIPPTLGSLVSLSGCIAAGPGGRANAVVAVLCVSRIPFPLRKDRANHTPEFSWASALAFDSVILGLTLYAILVVNRRAKHLPILTQIWRDGILFYIVITAANLANVALYARESYCLIYV